MEFISFWSRLSVRREVANANRYMCASEIHIFTIYKKYVGPSAYARDVST